MISRIVERNHNKIANSPVLLPSPDFFNSHRRDVASGLVVLIMMPIVDRRSIGLALIVYAIIPLGDMSIVLGVGGSRSKAFSIHGVTCAVMLVVGILLIHAM